jgi:hypothetical protein
MRKHVYDPAKIWLYPNYDMDDDVVLSITEKGIIDQYYTYWSQKMIKKFGEAHFEEHYSFSDCVDDWIVSNWAWSKEFQDMLSRE